MKRNNSIAIAVGTILASALSLAYADPGTPGQSLDNTAPTANGQAQPAPSQPADRDDRSGARQDQDELRSDKDRRYDQADVRGDRRDLRRDYAEQRQGADN